MKWHVLLVRDFTYFYPYFEEKNNPENDLLSDVVREMLFMVIFLSFEHFHNYLLCLGSGLYGTVQVI